MADLALFGTSEALGSQFGRLSRRTNLHADPIEPIALMTVDVSDGWATVVDFMGTTRAEAQTRPVDSVTGASPEVRFLDSALDRLAQSFVVSSAYRLTGVKFQMYRVGKPGTVTVELREMGTTDPTSTVIASATRNASTFTTATGGFTYRFDFNIKLTAGKTYVFVIRCALATGSHKVGIVGDTISVYAGGQSFVSTDGETTWTSNVKDLYFQTLRSGVSTLSRLGKDQELSGILKAVGSSSGRLTIQLADILIPFAPEGGMTESLGFLTDVLEKLDGREQRVRLRKYPRRQYGMTLRVDGTERQWLDNVLSGQQAGELYLPLWTQPTLLTSAAALHATSLTVDATWQSQAEFREGNRLVVWSDSSTWQMIEIDSLGSGTIGLTDEITRTAGYPVGTAVYPVVKVICPRTPSGSIMGLSMADVKIELMCKDNESDIASISGWDTLLGLPYLKDLHLGPSMGYVYDFAEVDFATGKTEQETRWTEGKQSRSLILVSNDRTTSWDLRCLLYYLAGKWKSFYLPTYLAEVPVISLVGTTLTIGNVGYSQYAAGRTLVRIVTSTEDTVKTVESSSDGGATEALILDSGVTGTVTRVEFVYRVRLDSDDISLTHANGLGTMRADMSVRSVPIGVKDLDEDE
jgi:hypothetical protein